MAKTALPITTFQLLNGAPVANGSISIRLNTDGNVSDVLLNTNYATIALDSSGTLVGSPSFWPNSEISPAGTYYIVTVYTKPGDRVAGPLKVIV
jgi:hypothetical protein